MKIQPLKRLLIEDFPDQDKTFLGNLFYIINQGFESVTTALNRNLTFEDNFKAQIKEIKVTAPFTDAIFVKNDLNVPVRDVIITNVTNLTDTTLLTAAPFLELDNNGEQLKIKNVVGLTAGKTYRIRFICFS